MQVHCPKCWTLFNRDLVECPRCKNRVNLLVHHPPIVPKTIHSKSNGQNSPSKIVIPETGESNGFSKPNRSNVQQIFASVIPSIRALNMRKKVLFLALLLTVVIVVVVQSVRMKGPSETSEAKPPQPVEQEQTGSLSSYKGINSVSVQNDELSIKVGKIVYGPLQFTSAREGIQWLEKEKFVLIHVEIENLSENPVIMKNVWKSATLTDSSGTVLYEIRSQYEKDLERVKIADEVYTKALKSGEKIGDLIIFHIKSKPESDLIFRGTPYLERSSDEGIKKVDVLELAFTFSSKDLD